MTAPVVLGIETSCDETACGVVRGREVLANVVASQEELHRDFGGVVPEIASRAHLERLPGIFRMAMEGAGIARADAVAVTTGPGLIGALLVGVSFAEGIVRGWDVPLIAVHHLYAHLWGVAVVRGVKPPFCGVVVSGGHTAFYVWEEAALRPAFLGGTVDDAAGEAFDKVASLLGLGYPGGPVIERTALEGSDTVDLPLAGADMPGLSVSFSGLKTAVLYHLKGMGREPDEKEKADIACSFQQRAACTIAHKTAKMLDETGLSDVVVGGGVAANRALREAVGAACEERGTEAHFPPPGLSQDNGAMTALYGGLLLEHGEYERREFAVPEPFPRGKERQRAL